LEPIKGGPQDPNRQVPARSLRPTTDQNNAAGFFDRMTEAEKVLSDPDASAAAMDYIGKASAGIPLVGNYLADPNYQRFDQAKRDFINAQLRKESGAEISPGEFDSADKQYFPQPGDSRDVIDQKARNRSTAIKSMRRTAAGALTQGGYEPQQDAPQTENPVEYQGSDGITEADLPNATQEALDAIAQGAEPQAVYDELVAQGVSPDYARTIINGQ
jgi:curved DNA-binding protein CbpA